MPYVLKDYSTGAALTQTDFAPQKTGPLDKFAQSGWTPSALSLDLIVDDAYLIDELPPEGKRQRIILKSIGAALNAITYVRAEG